MSERSVNKVTLVGRLGKNAEQKFTPSGVAVSQFSVATSSRWKDKASGEWRDLTEWHHLVFWRSENVSQYLVKGCRVYVEGRIQTRSWEGTDGVKRYRTEIVVEELILLGDGTRKPLSGAEQYDQPRPASSKAASADPPFDPGP